MENLAVSLINFYQKWLSFDTGVLRVFTPGGSCRNEVHCSEYTKRQIEEYGIMKGVWMGMKRIMACR